MSMETEGDNTQALYSLSALYRAFGLDAVPAGVIARLFRDKPPASPLSGGLPTPSLIRESFESTSDHEHVEWGRGGFSSPPLSLRVPEAIQEDIQKRWIATSSTPRNDIADLYLQKALNSSWLYRFCPFVRYVAVANTVAFETASDGSDIDLFIIVKKGHIHLARLFLFVATQLLGIRRHGKKIAGRLCLSFFMDDDPTTWDFSVIALSGGDPYLAWWLATLIPLYDPRDLHSELLKTNSEWLKREVGYEVPVIPDKDVLGRDPGSRIKNQKETFFKSLLEWFFVTSLGHFLESLANKIILSRAHKKMSRLTSNTGTIISDTILKFHDVDRREEIREKYEASLEKV